MAGIFKYTQLNPVIFGNGAIGCVGEELAKLGCKKLLFVCGPNVTKAGGTVKAEASLKAHGIDFLYWNEVKPDAPSGLINKAAEYAIKEGCDSVLGIGGGSCMDLAKAVALLLDLKETKIEKYLPPPPPTMQPEKVPIFLAPTTSGSGSEGTMVSVITDETTGQKQAIFIHATIGIIDPELTLTCPPSVTAQAGFDVMAHCIESITARDRNPHSELLALSALRRVRDNLVECFEHGDNLAARGEMALASNWAGLAFVDTDIQLGHATCDSISATCHTPHGIECAWVTPELLKIMADYVPEEIKKIAEAMRVELTGKETNLEVSLKIGDVIHQMMKACKVKSLKEYGATRQQVVDGAPLVVAARHLWPKCPVYVDKELTVEDAAKFLGDIYDNYQ
ncbi:MAG: iron-containing alcohol dehydrogenase [Oscillospiraceae bacterium]|nr:iron-containing alcohol dehydrogenase [Oscillospiraceae bacterium]